jgi:hypothetical protein
VLWAPCGTARLLREDALLVFRSGSEQGEEQARVKRHAHDAALPVPEDAVGQTRAMARDYIKVELVHLLSSSASPMMMPSGPRTKQSR